MASPKPHRTSVRIADHTDKARLLARVSEGRAHDLNRYAFDRVRYATIWKSSVAGYDFAVNHSARIAVKDLRGANVEP